MDFKKILFLIVLSIPLYLNGNIDKSITEIELINKKADDKSILKWAKFLRSNCYPYKNSEILIREKEIIADIKSYKLNVECEGSFHVLPKNNALGNILNNISFKNTKLNKIEGMSNVIEAKSITLENNDSLQSIEGFSSIKRITENYIIKNAKFKDINFLSNLIKVRKLHIEDTPIENLKGLNRYLNCDEIYLNKVDIEKIRDSNLGIILRRGCRKITINNTNLKELSGLEIVRGLDFLDIQNNKIESITGIANLSNVDFINAKNNKINNIHGLRRIKKIRYLDLSNNKIKSVSGLRNLEEVEEYIRLNENEIETLEKMNKLKKAGTLDLSNNKITDISGLKSLEEVDYSIILDRNNLKTLEGLENLKKVKAIYLRSNPRLNDLSALNNLKEGKLYIDSKEYKIKLDSESYFCKNFKDKVFYGYEESDFDNKSSFCY